MQTSRKYDGIDCARLVAAFLIVGIHTYPLRSINADVNFLFVHVFARIGVPFFLMATGYFLMPQYLGGGSVDRKPLINFIKKTGLLYLGATLLYLPVSIYAGHYADGNLAATILRKLVFDGTFYHLWYLPASIIGVLLVYVLGRRLSAKWVLGVSACLYVLGLLGDSYYGLVLESPVLRGIYDAGFQRFSYTRNGLFYAPIFLALGAVLGASKGRIKTETNAVGLIFSVALLLVEGVMLHRFEFTRHDSMYIALVPCMFFLFQLIRGQRGRRSFFLRDTSMWVYILHPLVIVGVRGVMRVVGGAGVVLENSLVFYITVAGLSFAAAALIARWKLGRRAISFRQGRAWTEIDLENLRHNVKTLQRMLPDTCALMPAVKAEAYGHGAKRICRELNRLKVRAFCVASVMEGVALR
ncbi:MAG: acyltransferase family protein, partial [Oscillospiraceae bacterium]|nr:acyltransferase family protein [Oscillospiraceae bacterium]